jgi:hypothetical protein
VSIISIEDMIGVDSGFRVSLNVAYPCEILPYRLRANGLMIQSLATNVMLFFNQYVNPIGIQHASWKYYFLFEATLLI